MSGRCRRLSLPLLSYHFYLTYRVRHRISWLTVPVTRLQFYRSTRRVDEPANCPSVTECNPESSSRISPLIPAPCRPLFRVLSATESLKIVLVHGLPWDYRCGGGPWGQGCRVSYHGLYVTHFLPCLLATACRVYLWWVYEDPNQGDRIDVGTYLWQETFDDSSLTRGVPVRYVYPKDLFFRRFILSSVHRESWVGVYVYTVNLVSDLRSLVLGPLTLPPLNLWFIVVKEQ